MERKHVRIFIDNFMKGSKGGQFFERIDNLSFLKIFSNDCKKYGWSRRRDLNNGNNLFTKFSKETEKKKIPNFESRINNKNRCSYSDHHYAKEIVQTIICPNDTKLSSLDLPMIIVDRTRLGILIPRADLRCPNVSCALKLFLTVYSILNGLLVLVHGSYTTVSNQNSFPVSGG